MATGPLTTPQVARLAHVSIRTVLRAVHDGDLKAEQIGDEESANRPYIYERAEVARWIRDRTEQQETA